MSSDIILYGAMWCGSAIRTRNWLDQHHIPYRWVDIDRDPAAKAVVRQINNGFASVPTLVFPNGATLTEPTPDQLKAQLGLT